MVGGLSSAMLMSLPGGKEAAGWLAESETATRASAFPGGIPTFAFLDKIVETLGKTKVTFFPFLESTGSILRVRSYGGGNSGTRILVAAGAPTATEPKSADLRYPYRHVGGVHSLYFHPGINPVENLHLVGEEHEQYRFPGNIPFSMGAWFLPRAESRGTLIAKWDEAGSAREWRLAFNGPLRLVEFSAYDGANGGRITQISDRILEFNKWHFAVASYDGDASPAGINLFVDGRLDHGVSSAEGTFSSITPGTAALMVGASGVTSAPTDVFTGRMALPFVCGKPLTSGETTLLFGLGIRLLGLA